MNRLVCSFEPMDTWFFRESRPQGSVGSSELASVFPPPVRTLLGAVRTAIGDAWHAKHGTNWRDFESNAELRALIGFGDDLGNLRVQGPWLRLNGKRLYPAPFNLMHKGDIYFLMPLGDAVRCDLGVVHLPQLPAKVPGLKDLAGARPAQGKFVTEEGWSAILRGQAPHAAEVVEQQDLFTPEPRLGIGRDIASGAVTEGMLYQTRHLRVRDGVKVELVLDGLPESALKELNFPAHTLVRLGGEGRQAMLSTHTAKGHPSMPAAKLLTAANKGEGPTAVLYNMTSLPCAPETPAGIPQGLSPKRGGAHDGVDVWEGEINGVKLRAFAAVTGKAQREGGWDLAQHRPRAVQSLAPAGNALYVTALSGDLSSLHDHPCGPESEFGRGHYWLGTLPT